MDIGRLGGIGADQAARLMATDDGHPVAAPIVAAIADSDPSPGWVPLTWTGSDIVVDTEELVGIFVGTSGSVEMTGTRGDATFKNIGDGTLTPLRPSVIKSTSTARDLVAVYST